MLKSNRIVSLTLLLLLRCDKFPLHAEAFTAFSRLIWRRAPRSLGCRSASKGMGNTSINKKKNGAKKKKNGSPTSFNVNASLLRLEKKYDDLSLANAKTLQSDVLEKDDDIVATEYIVAVRSSCLEAVADWVPVAQLIVARTWAESQTSAFDGASDPLLQAIVSLYCRELSHVASLGSKYFQSVPRNQLEYAIESCDSFYKHVYDTVLQGKNEDASNENVMTKEQARRVLELDVDCTDLNNLKTRYRKRSFELHPDRFVGNGDQVASAAASAEYARVKLAYETLSSGVRRGSKSWYETLGGRARTELVGPVKLLPLQLAQETVEAGRVQSAIVGLNPEMVQGFVVRAQAAVA